MLVSLNWLKQFVKIPKNISPEELGNLLTLKTAEVEKVIEEGEMFKEMVAGHVITVKQHPNADKLKIAETSIGKETLQIVCGGENLKEGMYVSVAKVGAEVTWHGEDEKIKLKRTKIRDVESLGMICAGEEIGIEDDSAGEKDIMDLSALKPEPGTPLSEVFEKNDILFEFDNKSLTHRPDLWGHYGIAREISAITGEGFIELIPKVKLPKTGDSPKITVEDKELCPRYCGLIIENIEVKDSPPWLKKRLKATGHGTHNNIVDITNYILTELGQPMHAFDKDKIKGEITVRRARQNEKIETLDNETRTLSDDMLIIADDKKALAVAGVIGGKDSEIDTSTTAIILEAANFHGASVRRTSTKLGIRTDSVQRFEKSLSPFLPELAIKRAAELILEVCPTAKISGPITDIKNFDETPRKITLSTERTRSKIGVDISNEEIIKILEALQFNIKKKSKNILEITIPNFRPKKDISIEDDLIEEVTRMYSYDKIPATLPLLPIKLPKQNKERTKIHQTRKLLSLGLGLNEVYNYSFYGKKDLKNTLLSEGEHLQILNYLSEDQTHMRTNLAVNLLKNLQLNIKNFKDIAIYEIGRTYLEIGEFYPLEETHIGGAILKKGKEETFFNAKGIVETFMDYFKIQGIKEVDGAKNSPYGHPKKSLTFMDFKGETIAKICGLHPVVQKNMNLNGYTITLFDINLTKAFGLPEKKHKFKPLPKFPEIKLDISVVIDKLVKISKLQNAIKNVNKALISNIELFDIYEGENISSDKKAIAFKITLQAKDRTLTDNEMTKTQTQIFKSLEKLGGEIRGK